VERARRQLLPLRLVRDAIQAALDDAPAPPLPSALPAPSAESAPSRPPNFATYWRDLTGHFDAAALEQENAAARAAEQLERGEPGWRSLLIVLAPTTSSDSLSEARSASDAIVKARSQPNMTTVVIGMDDGTAHVLVPGTWANARVEKLLAKLRTALAAAPPVTRDRLRAAVAIALDEIRAHDADRRKEENAKGSSAFASGSDSFSYFFYGLAAVIALIFVGVIRSIFFARPFRSGDAPSGGYGGGDGASSSYDASSSTSSSFDSSSSSSSSSSFDSSSSSSSSSDSSYTGGDGSSGGGGSSDSW
jgi:hypothetical protein